MDLKELLGEELHKQLTDKLGDKHKVAIVSDGAWIPKDKFNQVNEAKNQLEVDIKDRDKSLEELKKTAGDSKALQDEIAKLQEANKAKDTEYQTKINDLSVSAAIERSLVAASAKFPDLLISKIDKAKIELLQDGTVKGLEDQLKTLKESYKDLFGEEKIVGGAPGKGGDPDPNPDPTKMSDDEWFKQALKDDKK